MILFPKFCGTRKNQEAFCLEKKAGEGGKGGGGAVDAKSNAKVKIPR